MGFIETLRQFRIGPFTVFDTLTAYLGVFLFTLILFKVFPKVRDYIPLSSWMWLTLPIGVLFHLIFHVNSPFMKMLLDPNGSYVAKGVLIFMLLMGLRRLVFRP